MDENTPQRKNGRSAKILIVDDDAYIRKSLLGILNQSGFNPLEAQDGKTALDRLAREEVDLMLLDLEMPRVGGMDVLRRSVADHPNLPIVIVTGKGTIPRAVEAIQLGAYDFLEKPVDAQRLLHTIHNALEKVELERQRDYLLGEARERYRMIGSSSAMGRVYRLIDKAARANVRVLITGKNGTGKELVARAIHHNSSRAGRPFIAVNCAAIPEDLIESELFGHERGAFTGAQSLRRGKIEQAHGGTLFLDEVGDMSLRTQAKVLRALEEDVIERVGGQRPVPVDVRLIAATNKDLEAEIEAGNFREDLYYRLNVVHIELPPLQRRREDIPTLVDHFLALFSNEHGIPARKLAPGVMDVLTQYEWPGNVRQLRNVIERLVVLSEGEKIGMGEIEQALKISCNQATDMEPQQATLRQARARFERRFIVQMLTSHNWQIQDTASALGITRGHLWKKMQEYGIEQVV